MVSFIFVLGTMIEFAIILWIKQRQNENVAEMDLRKSMTNQQISTVNESQTLERKNRIDKEMKRKMKKIDQTAFALFTVTYLIFNIFYFLFSRLAR